MAKNISGPDIWRKVINDFNRAKLSYILVGAAALVVHGMPRSTLDIDIYVPAKKDILEKLFRIAERPGLKSSEKSILRFGDSPKLFSNQWICFSYKGQDILDVFLSPEEEYNKLYKNSQIKRDKDMIIRVASLRDLKTMKKASGRPQDLADLKLIEEAERYRKRIK